MNKFISTVILLLTFTTIICSQELNRQEKFFVQGYYAYTFAGNVTREMDTMQLTKGNMHKYFTTVLQGMRKWKAAIDTFTAINKDSLSEVMNYETLIQSGLIGVIADSCTVMVDKYCYLNDIYKMKTGINFISELIGCVTAPAECLIKYAGIILNKK